MNYYLARDGQTYGPYPQESFPAMLQQGQVVPNDLVCPEGGNDWAELSKVPGMSGTAPAPMAGLAAPPVAASSKSGAGGFTMPTVAASSSQPAASPVATPAAMPVPTGSKLRISGGGAAKAHSPGVAASTPAAAPAAAAYPAANYSQHKPGLMEKAAGAWGVLRIIGYAAVVIVVIVGLIIGFVASQREKKEIAKLASEPGWAAFDRGNSQLSSESSIEGYGNNSDATRAAKKLAEATEQVQRASFKVEKTPRYRGRSKLGRISSAIDSATTGTGHFQTYVELREDRVIVLVRVPEFKLYKGEARSDVSEMCYAVAQTALSEAMKMAAALEAVPALGLAGGRNPAPAGARPPSGRTPGTRPPGGRPPTGATASAAPAQPPAPKPEPKVPKEIPLIVGVRGSDGYECVFVGKAGPNASEDTPNPIKKNVPSHRELVKWFGTDKPTAE